MYVTLQFAKPEFLRCKFTKFFFNYTLAMPFFNPYYS